jgi:hypothetical protein
MTEKDNVIAKIESIDKESNSQIDKNRVKEESFKNLMGFLNGYIQRSTSKSLLKEKVEKMLFDKLEAEEEDVPYGVLIKLQEILSKGETDAAIPILKIIESATKSEKETEQPSLTVNQNNTVPGITVEDMKGYKKLLDLLEIQKDLKKTEFSEGEK